MDPKVVSLDFVVTTREHPVELRVRLSQEANLWKKIKGNVVLTPVLHLHKLSLLIDPTVGGGLDEVLGVLFGAAEVGEVLLLVAVHQEKVVVISLLASNRLHIHQLIMELFQRMFKMSTLSPL